MNTNSVVRLMPWSDDKAKNPEPLVTREWLISNGLGGYATGTVAGVCTRRFHGLLIAALRAPMGRTMMLNHLAESVRLPDYTAFKLGGHELEDGSLELPNPGALKEFRLEAGLPVWTYQLGSYVVEKKLHLVYRQNTVHITYCLIKGEGTLRLKLRPSIHFRPHEGRVDGPFASASPYVLNVTGGRYELSSSSGDCPPLRMQLTGDRGAFTSDGGRTYSIEYRIEKSRGYDARGPLWSPGAFHAQLSAGRDVTLVASTEPWETLTALSPGEGFAAEQERRERLLAQAHQATRSEVAAELVFAADQFLITPMSRVEEAARAYAAGDEARTVIAGYHWFTDWGRDTMISLEGLTLTTGRYAEAGYILRTFAHYVRDGLLPNMFPEGTNTGLYHTADATLWFFHAIQRYVKTSGDQQTLRQLLPTLRDIVDRHVHGTLFGIGVDPEDGLLRQGAQGYQLTWMDAKVDDWVVTPRRGKAVEINALWYNALRLLEGWLQELEGDEAAKPITAYANQVRASFNRRFWYEEGGYLYDVIDGEAGHDSACRPNQLFALSLDHPVLDRERWEPLLRIVHERLVTPVGLRSLAPGHPDYKPRYDGDLRSRDAAYHQGTVWAWLVGPFVDAWLRVFPQDQARARRFLEGFEAHLGDACLGSISEIFDAEAPFTPRGCVAQAWSVAEVLRCWLKTQEAAA